MKFWTIENTYGETIGCELTKREALSSAKAQGLTKDDVVIEAVDVDVTAETIRRLLGHIGGYAK